MNQVHRQPSIEWQRAIAFSMRQYKKNPEIHHHVFASVVAFATSSTPCRMSVINTMRSRLAVSILFKHKSPGNIDFDEIVELVAECCFGPITLEHARIYQQLHFDNLAHEDSKDIEDAILILQKISLTTDNHDSVCFLDREA